MKNECFGGLFPPSHIRLLLSAMTLKKDDDHHDDICCQPGALLVVAFNRNLIYNDAKYEAYQ